MGNYLLCKSRRQRSKSKDKNIACVADGFRISYTLQGDAKSVTLSAVKKTFQDTGAEYYYYNDDNKKAQNHLNKHSIDEQMDESSSDDEEDKSTGKQIVVYRAESHELKRISFDLFDRAMKGALPHEQFKVRVSATETEHGLEVRVDLENEYVTPISEIIELARVGDDTQRARSKEPVSAQIRQNFNRLARLVKATHAAVKRAATQGAFITSKTSPQAQALAYYQDKATSVAEVKVQEPGLYKVSLACQLVPSNNYIRLELYAGERKQALLPNDCMGVTIGQQMPLCIDAIVKVQSPGETIKFVTRKAQQYGFYVHNLVLLAQPVI